MKKKWFRKLLRKRFFIGLLILIQLCVLVFLLTNTGVVSSVLGFLLPVVSILACLYIISRKGKGEYKLTWVFLIMLFPVLGGAFYLLFNFQSTTKRAARKIEQLERKARPLLAVSDEILSDACENSPEHTQPLRYLHQFAGFPVYRNTSTTYFASGEEKWEQLLVELEKAQNYIFLEYFIVQEGVMWDAILSILKKKAAQGVLVRLIYDDFGCFFLLPKDYPKQLKQYGIECVAFNRFKPFLTVVQNNRDHRKIAVIDGKVAFTGGINLADEYINAIEKHGHWKDAAVMLKGEAAWSFTLMFLQMWEFCTAKNEDYSLYNPWNTAPSASLSDGYVQPYADSPIDKENVGEHTYLHLINHAKRYIYINTPYLILDDHMISALCLAAKSGVDVRIITPHKWDKWAVHMTTRSYYRELIRAGVKIYEYTDGFIHSKTVVSDDVIATVGTTNFDYRSLYLHFECGVCLYGCAAVQDVKDDFSNTLTRCRQITEEHITCNLFLRIFQDLMRVIAPFM